MTTELTDTELSDTAPREGWGERRSRVVSWHDPAPTTSAGMRMAGIDYLRAMIDGQLPQPPIAGLMQLRLESAEPGRVVFSCQPDESAYNPIGSVHGGLICTVLDSVAGCALHSTLPQGKGYTSVEIKVNFLKGVQVSSGPLTAVGSVVKAGSRVGFTEGVVTDSSGTVVATATSTLLIFDV
jgi:uncharacterized protein (TIGR00369 family)